MLVRSWMLTAAALTLTAGAAAAATFGPENNPGSVSGLPLSAQEVFNSMTGEFEGTLQKLGPDGKLAKSAASASNKTENNGRRLVSAFESTVNGDNLDGAVIYSASNSAAATSTWSYDDTPFSSTGKVQNREMSFNGQPASGAGAKIEQTVTVLNFNSYQIAWNRIESNGAKTLVMHLDMRRMGDGKKSAASKNADSSRAIAVAKSAMEGVQRTAGVNE